MNKPTKTTKKPKHDVAALAAAIKRLLGSENDTHKAKYPTSGSSYTWGGRMTGIGGLFSTLVDSKYRAVIERPHDAGSLKTLLRREAINLHREHGIIVSLNGSIINLNFADD